MEILYISSVPSKKEFYRMKTMLKENVNIASYGMSESGFKFHSLIIDGLSHNENVHIFSLVGRSVDFKTYEGFFWRTLNEQGRPNVRYKHLGFFNIPLIKQYIISSAFFFNTLGWLIKNHGEVDKYVVMDASYVTVIPFVIFATKLIPCKKAAIFCDIYEYMGNVKDARETEQVGILHRFFRTLMSKIYRRLDGFILLTEKMNDVVNPRLKPYEVVEGLVDHRMVQSDNKIENKSPDDVVMYAGALREQYGLKNLVEGFSRYQNDNAGLWIFGAGDYAPAIQDAAQKDNRIQFFGLADQEDIVKKEMEAVVLVNPRPTDREFTQYSFPSKNMEYMASGTPVLTTRLPGMPKEYYDYIYTIDGDGPEDITEALEKIFSYSKGELHEKGLQAKKFVLEYKNNIAQANKMINLFGRM